MSNKTISFKHSGNTGDIIYAMAGIKQVCEDQEKKADIYLWLDRDGYYYEGATHPLGGVMLNKYMYKMVKPLLLSQPYVNSVSKFEGEKIHVDLNLIRTVNIGMPYGNIAKWYAYIFPDMSTDLSRPWINDIPAGFEFLGDKILLNRTSRYRNPHISYAFLRFRKDVLYVGTQDEYKKMQKEIKNLVYLEVSSFLELASAIKSCKFFIGNQSMCFAIAEAMKTPRILEVCNFAPNVIPSGPGPAYDFYSQQALEYYVEELDKRAKPVFIEEKLRASEFRDAPRDPKWYPGADVTKNTLVDFPRLAKIKEYVEETNSLPGHVAEVGVYKGGTALLIRKNTTKNLYLFDTFEGMPQTSEVDSGHKAGDFADTSEEYVKSLIATDELKHGDTFITKGIFPDSTWKVFVGNEKFSFVHIDCDIYQSVKDSLEHFYPKMVQGGIICLDDVNEPGCPGAKKAFDEFMAYRLEHKLGDSRHIGQQVFDIMECQSQVAIRIL